MVDVSSQNNSASINVSSGGNSASINATPDMAQYYSEKAREWAISNRIVDNTDYSSKYYAEKSKESETNSSNYERSVIEKYNSFVEVSNQAEAELQTLRDDSILQINTVASSGISDIANKTSEAITNLNTNIETATSEINNVKNNAVTQLSKEAQEQLKNIESTGFYMRDDKLYFINSKGEEEEFVSGGGGGLELGDIGIAPLGIDETKGKRRYLNGQIIIQEQYVQFTNKVKSAVALYPSLACTESEWQTIATMTVGGQVGKFVVDDAQGTIRLPRIIMPIQGLTDLSKLAEIVEAGLPNITGSTNQGGATNSAGEVSANGAFADTEPNAAMYTTSSSGRLNSRINFDASKSNPIYGNSDTVQQEQIQYPYFIQVATGAEESIDVTRATEIVSPFFLGMSQYFETAPNNPSWVKSQGQYNSKAVYPDYYDWLLEIYNGTETQEGVSVKLATESYTDYDFVINQADETFRFPLLNGSEAIVSDKVKDFGNPASNTNHIAPANGWFNLHRTATANNQYIYLGTSTVTKQSESVASGTNLRIDIEVKRGDSVFVSYNAPTAGYFRFIYAKGNGYLYYYVGEGIVNPQLVNVARIEEVKANKTDVDGQWVGINPTTLTTITSGSVTLDLSDILPSDNYAYELLLFDLIGGISQGQIRVQLSSSLIPRSGSTNECFMITRGDSTGTGDGTAIFPVGADKTLTLTLLGMGASGTPGAGHALILCGYRRLGANI